MIKKLLSTIFITLLLAGTGWGALVEGTNCGFVTTSPVSDPSGSGTLTVDNASRASKFTAPVGATTITEIGWWSDVVTEESNFEVGVYSDNGGGGTSLPTNLIYSNQTNAKGTTAGWKSVTGLSFSITGGTIYWIAVQVDDTATSTKIDYQASINRMDVDTAHTTTLGTTWTSSSPSNNAIAVYAVYTTGSATRRPMLIQ